MDTQIFKLKQQDRVYSVFLTSRLCDVIWKLSGRVCLFFCGQIVSFLLFWDDEIEEKTIFLFDLLRFFLKKVVQALVAFNSLYLLK
jgi:hypothetical protein